MTREVLKVDQKTFIPTSKDVFSKIEEVHNYVQKLNSTDLRSVEAGQKLILNKFIPEYISDNLHYLSLGFNYYQDLGNGVVYKLNISNSNKNDKRTDGLFLESKLMMLDSIELISSGGANIECSPALKEIKYYSNSMKVGEGAYGLIGACLLSLNNNSSIEYYTSNFEKDGFIATLYNPTQKRVIEASKAFKEFNQYCREEQEDIFEIAHLLMSASELDKISRHFSKNSDRENPIKKEADYFTSEVKRKIDALKEKHHFSKTGLEKYLV